MAHRSIDARYDGDMSPTPAPLEFTSLLAEARSSGGVRFDLTEADPERCGLSWDPVEFQAILAARSPAAPGAAPAGLPEARDAVASYLAGKGASVAPERVLFAGSRRASRRLALEAVSDPGDDVLVPAPARPFLEPGDAPVGVRTIPYRLMFEGSWRLDRRSIRRALTARTRAIVVGNPADPTGALLSGEELTFLEALCAERGLALVGDEGSLEAAAPEPGTTVARASRCVAIHLSGVPGVCGLREVAVEWAALAGPEPLVQGALARASSRAGGVAAPALGPIPALLARREPFLAVLRARLAVNRAAIATASLREAPWTLQWGGGGCWAVLQINPVQDEDVLCVSLLRRGLAVQPGHLDGLPRKGYLVVSLLPEPPLFAEALALLEAALREQL